MFRPEAGRGFLSAIRYRSLCRQCQRKTRTPARVHRLMEGTIMSMYSILPDGKLAITASESSSKHDFDFLAGGWKIRNRKLKEPLSGRDDWVEFDATQNCRQILQGFGDF